MKITKQRLKQIIKEELETVMSERYDQYTQDPKRLTYIEMRKKGRNYYYKVGGEEGVVEGNYFEVQPSNYAFQALSMAADAGFFLNKSGIDGVKVIIDSDNQSTEPLMMQGLEKLAKGRFKGQFEKIMQDRKEKIAGGYTGYS